MIEQLTMNKFMEEDLIEVGKKLLKLQTRIENEIILAKSKDTQKLKRAAGYFKSKNLMNKAEQCIANIPKNPTDLLTNIKDAGNPLELAKALRELINSNNRPDKEEITSSITKNKFSWNLAHLEHLNSFQRRAIRNNFDLWRHRK